MHFTYNIAQINNKLIFFIGFYIDQRIFGTKKIK